jgi:hypothetical protein
MSTSKVQNLSSFPFHQDTKVMKTSFFVFNRIDGGASTSGDGINHPVLLSSIIPVIIPWDGSLIELP